MGVGHECTRERRRREKESRKRGNLKGTGKDFKKDMESVRSVLSCRKDMWGEAWE